MNKLSSFLKDTSGATAIEYGLIATLIAVALVGTLGTVGNNLNTQFGAIATTISPAPAGP